MNKNDDDDENGENLVSVYVFVAGIRYWEVLKINFAPDVKMENVNCVLCDCEFVI